MSDDLGVVADDHGDVLVTLLGGLVDAHRGPIQNTSGNGSGSPVSPSDTAP
jgi:hypothetical protein